MNRLESNMTRILALVTTLLAPAILAAACGFEHKTTVIAPSPAPSPAPAPTGPGGGTPGPQSFVGTWASESTSSTLPDPSTCTSFRWTVTSQSETSMAGDLVAECLGNVTITGSATGQLASNGTILLAATGTATSPGIPPCDISLVGTGTMLDATTMRIDYTGTTCAGPIQGTHTLRRR